MDSNGSEPESGWRPRPAVNRQRAAGRRWPYAAMPANFTLQPFAKPYMQPKFLKQFPPFHSEWRPRPRLRVTAG